MKFHVGAHTYVLVVADRRLYDENNDELEGRAMESPRLIVLSPIVEPERREEVARHEYLHCWEHHVPPAQDAEQRANFFAFISAQFDADLDAQGGPAALLKMPTTRMPRLGGPAVARSAPLAGSDPFSRPDRMTCSGCESEVMVGSIQNGEPVLHQFTGKVRVERYMRCEACGTLTVWSEIATADGTPTGEIVAHPKPQMLRGAEASAWLASRPKLVTAE